MRNKGWVIADTSIWIEYFNRPKSNKGEELQRLLEEDRVVMVGVIMAELLQGAKDNDELKVLKEAFIALPFLKTDRDVWEETGALSFRLRQKGEIIPITDCLIAALAIEEGCSIFTLDYHFKRIEGIRLYEGGKI